MNKYRNLAATLASIIFCFIMLKFTSNTPTIANTSLAHFLGGVIGVLTTYIFNVIVHKIPTVLYDNSMELIETLTKL